MGSTSSSPTVRLLFPLGMAIRHRASSPLLPSYSHLFASLLFFSLLSLRLLCFFWYWAISWYGRIVLTWYVLPWRCWTYCHYVVYRGMQYRRYAGNPIFNQLNKVSPPSGHWNPETLEPRVHREGKGHRPENREKAPTRGTVFLFFFRYPLGSHRRSLRCAFHCRAAHGGYDVLGRCTLVAGEVFGLLFPETLKGRCGPTATVELSGRRL